MAILGKTITLQNSCDFVGKAKDTFAPLKETITNSFDSIILRQKKDKSFTPSISVAVYFITKIDTTGEKTPIIDFISVEDNGIGFTPDNLRNFKELASKTKGLNNRGTGTIQVFCRFDKMTIDSLFLENGKWYKLDASWDKSSGEYEGEPIETQAGKDNKTIVKMSKFSSNDIEQKYFLRYLGNIDELKRDIVKHFLLHLWLANIDKALTLSVSVYLDNKIQNEFTFKKDNIPHPDKQDTITVATEKAVITTDKKRKTKVEWEQVDPQYTLTIHRFKMPSEDLGENSVHLCSKGIMVEPFKFAAIKRKDANFEGYRYVSSICGDIFENSEFISHAVDKFNFPSRKDTEAELKDGVASMLNPENKFVFREEIDKQIGEGLSKVYSDVKGLKEKRDEDMAEIATKYGISPEDVEATNVAFNDSDDEAVEKFFETQAKRIAIKNIEVRKTYEEIKELDAKDLDPTSDEYRTKFNELSNKLFDKIPQLNKDELARYIIRRDMVVDLLKLALKEDLAVQKKWAKEKVEAKEKGEKAGRTDKEGIIHDLIFKRRMKGVPNDLWILNEEFVHFDGCSEAELNELEIGNVKLLRDDVDIDAVLKAVGIDKKKSLDWRPDIFLYPEEGKCVLVEVKAPDVEMSDYCDQIQKYAKIIANFSTKKFTQFYGFLIGETINPLAIPSRYKKVPYGNYWIYPSEPINDVATGLPIADLYQEIMPLSEIAKRAEIRNRSFANKLGLKTDNFNSADTENIS